VLPDPLAGLLTGEFLAADAPTADTLAAPPAGPATKIPVISFLLSSVSATWSFANVT